MGCKDKEIRKSEFVSKTQLLYLLSVSEKNQIVKNTFLTKLTKSKLNIIEIEIK